MAPAASPLERDRERVGPHPSYIEIAKPYILQSRIQKCLSELSMSDAKEDAARLQGVAWIDQVRRALQLPIRTFNTAVIYYHKFRLLHADHEYNWADAAAAALFTACKIEDTLKKSREILCAHWNAKAGPGESLSSDDPRFDSTSKLIIGLERLMLESASFDFRNRYPQKVMVKLARALNFDANNEAKTAWNLSVDLYRTFAPLKQTTPTMAIACLELAARLHEMDAARLVDAGDVRYSKWFTSRAAVMETLLDLLDLYTHNRGLTSVGPLYTLEHFINIRIGLNQEASAANIPRYALYASEATSNSQTGTNGVKARNGIDPTTPRTPATPGTISPGTAQPPKSAIGQRGQDGTVRFMLDAARARDEHRQVDKFHKIEEEEYEVEVPNDVRPDDREKERARVGRDSTGDQDGWRKPSYGHDYIPDSAGQATMGDRRAGKGGQSYWDTYRQRVGKASHGQSATQSVTEDNDHIHPSRKTAKFGFPIDRQEVSHAPSYDLFDREGSIGSFHSRGSKQPTRGAKLGGQGRGHGNPRRGDTRGGEGDSFRELSYDRSVRRPSLSFHDNPKANHTTDQNGRAMSPARDWGSVEPQRAGIRGRRGDFYRRPSLDKQDREGSVASLESRKRLHPQHRSRSRSPSLPGKEFGPRGGRASAPTQSGGIRRDVQGQRDVDSTSGQVHPDRMALFLPTAEPIRDAAYLAADQPRRDSRLRDGKDNKASTRNDKQAHPSGEWKGLTAEDGHQWAKTGDDIGRGRGEGRGRGRKNQSNQRGGRGRGRDDRRQYALSTTPASGGARSPVSPRSFDLGKRRKREN